MTQRKTTTGAHEKPGWLLRKLRFEGGWTLADVSERTGLPVSTLSKMENDKMSLTYDKLVRISEGLNLDMAVVLVRLFSESPAESPQTAPLGRRSLVRSGEGHPIDTGNYKHIYPATDLLEKRFTPCIVEACNRSLEEFGELIRHSGEEYAYVVEGEIELHTSLYAPIRLSVGDSIYFDSNMPHAYLAVGDGPCRFLCICSASPIEPGSEIESTAAADEASEMEFAAPVHKRGKAMAV